MNHYTDKEMNDDLNKDTRDKVKNIKMALEQLKITPESEWQIKFDTLHFKLNTGVAIRSCIIISENVNIRLCRGPEPIDSKVFVISPSMLPTSTHRPILLIVQVWQGMAFKIGNTIEISTDTNNKICQQLHF